MKTVAIFEVTQGPSLKAKGKDLVSQYILGQDRVGRVTVSAGIGFAW